MKIAVTGSNGFVGRKLVKRLISEGYDVFEIDFDKGFDLTHWEGLQNIPEFDLVFHLAAKTYVPDSFTNPREFYNSNINSTLNVLQLCNRNKARVILASSYVYGVPDYLPIDENHPLKSFNPYSNTKIVCEQLCRGYHQDFGIKAIIIRPFNIYGDGQNSNFLIPSILKQARSGKITLKDPEPKRDLVFVDDVVDAYMLTINYTKKDFDVFNIGQGISYSVREIAEIISSKINNKVEVIFTGEKRQNEVKDTVACIEKAANELLWVPKKTFDEGIVETINREMEF